MDDKDTDEERDIDEAQAFYKINGEWVPIFEITPEMERSFYAAGEVGPEGMTISHSRPRNRADKDHHEITKPRVRPGDGRPIISRLEP